MSAPESTKGSAPRKGWFDLPPFGADEHRWLQDGAILLGCIAALSALFWREAAGAVAVWLQSPTFNHGFLILPLALFMMWTRRGGLTHIVHRADWRVALLALPLSFAWFATSIASVLELQQFVVVTILQVMHLAVLGWQPYRRFLPAFLYLYFLVPSGAEFVPALQQVTAHLAVVGLHLIGIPVYSNGAVIEIPAGTFAVAEACAGLRFLVATIAFGVFYAMEIYSSVIRRLIFIGLCIVVPIFANGARVFGLIAAAQWVGSPTAVMADHLIYGWGFFSLVLVALVFIGNTFADARAEPQSASPATTGRPNLGQMAMAAVLCLAAAAAAPVASSLIGTSGAERIPTAPPVLASSWHEIADDDSWKPVIADPSRTFFRKVTDGTHTLYSFIALYPARGRTNNLVRSNNRLADEHLWKLNSDSSGTLMAGGARIPVREATFTRADRKLKTWSFYIVDGKFLASLWAVKLEQLKSYLRGDSCASAFVAIAADDSDSDAAQSYLSSAEPLPAYLCRTGH